MISLYLLLYIISLTHETFPFAIELLMYYPPHFTRIPLHLTNPSSSVLNNGKHLSRIFFFGFITLTFSFVNNYSWPSNTSRSLTSPFGLRTSITVCSSFDAHTTIPFDWKPANGLGFKFTMTKQLPVIDSIGTNCWRPEAIYLTSPKTSIFSQ